MSTWSKHFLTFFFLQVVWIRVIFPGRSGSNQVGWTNEFDRVVEDDIIHDVIALGTCVSAWRVTTCGWERSVSECECMRIDGGACFVEAAFVGVSRGAWRRITVFLGLKFSGFVERGTLDQVAVSVL